MDVGMRRTVGRHALQYGLSWKLLTRDDLMPRVWARQEARKAGARFGLMKGRDDGATRLGLLLGARVSGSVYSGAQWLAETVQGPTLALEYLGENAWWICRVEPGEVIADEVVAQGDARDRAEEESQALMELLQAAEHEADVTMPAVYIIGERQIDTMVLSRLARVTRRTTREELFAGTPPEEAELAQLVGLRPRTIATLFALGVVAVGAYAGVVAWQAHVEAQRQEAERLAALAREAEAARLRTLAQVRAVQAVRRALEEDTTNPAPPAVVSNCLRAVSAVGERYAGWRVERVECDPQGREASFELRIAMGQPGFEPLATLLQMSEANGHAVAADIATGTALVRVGLPAPEPRRPMALQELATFLDLQRGLLSRLQLVQHANVGTTITVTPPSPRAIRFAAPEHDQTPDHPERWVNVPPERGYSTGALRISGQSMAVLDGVRLGAPYAALRKLSLQPSGTGDWNWEMEASYVAAAL
jgi:hypothetical protein